MAIAKGEAGMIIPHPGSFISEDKGCE